MESLLIVVAGVQLAAGALAVCVFFDAPNDFYEGQ